LEAKPLQGEDSFLSRSTKRCLYVAWLILIGAFAVLHALHLSADFPNNTPWHGDWAKYTDEGWYGNAAVRAHLFGDWYMPGDFNPAAAVPVWPLLEWIVFSMTGVKITAARGLAVAFFFANLTLSYWFVRVRGERWTALLAVTLLVTSPFLYCFSRLAILEPLLMACTLGALNLAARLPRMRQPVRMSVAIGVLFTLMMLTKTTAVFLLPALGWALLMPLWKQGRLAMRCAAAAGLGAVVSFGLWIALIVRFGLWRDYVYLFVVNKYLKPTEWYWPVLSLWWSFHGGLWVDRLLIPLAGLATICGVLGWRSPWGRRLWHDPAFGTSILAVAGYILFMTYQNHPQPRYFAVVAFFSFFVLCLAIEALMTAMPPGPAGEDSVAQRPTIRASRLWNKAPALAGTVLTVVTAVTACRNAVWMAGFAAHPDYTYVHAAARLTRYIDTHPNGKRLLLSISGDEITMMTHLPSICDDFGTQDLVGKLAVYQPAWFATWNDLDPGTLEDLHSHYALEQVATFHALDDPERNDLVLFKLHPLPQGNVRDPGTQNLQVPLPGDTIDIPIQ
jgi:4-amino-4-deoxy-L-arabinose transferase-like glycosyltransferase